MGDPTLVVGDKVGEYEVTGVLGKGGMGTVYSGVHPDIGKKVAIKVLNAEVADSPDMVDRFLQEARAVNQVGHRNIIDIFAFGELPGGGHYFVMEHLPGRSAQDVLEQDGPMSVHDLVPLIEQVAEAIDAAHEVGIYHRDLKPDNVYLVPQKSKPPIVKVLDFGIAKLTDSAAVAQTKTGVPMGTPMFMSPEQWQGRGVDHLTDIYALGVMVYHLVTGRFPFVADTFPELMYKHLNEDPRTPSLYGAPKPIDAVIKKALAKEKDRRYASAAQLAAALAEASRRLSADALMATVAPPPPEETAADKGSVESKSGQYYASPGATVPPDRTRRTALFAAIALLAIGGAVAAFVGLRGGDEPAEAAGTSTSPAPKTTVDTATQDAATGSSSAETEQNPTGSVTLVQPIRGTQATIDGERVELTGRQTRLDGLRPGRHVVTAEAEGYQVEDFVFVVEPGAPQVVSLELVQTGETSAADEETAARSTRRDRRRKDRADKSATGAARSGNKDKSKDTDKTNTTKPKSPRTEIKDPGKDKINW